jgi:hypothetical protein
VGLIFAKLQHVSSPVRYRHDVVVTALPRIVPWLFDKVGKRLPVYLVGMALAPFFEG